MKIHESLWERSHTAHRVLARRATGELPQMEASQYLAGVIAADYKNGETVLDVGCGPGHFYRSFQNFLPQDCYTGTDLSPKMIEVAKECFPAASFSVLALEDTASLNGKFDHVVCSNVIPHVDALRPAMKALMSATKKRLYIRALFADQTFLIKHVHNSDNYPGVSDVPVSRELDDSNIPADYHNFNIYSKKLIASIATEFGAKDVKVFDDEFIDHDKIMKEQKSGKNVTRSIGGQLVIGNIVCPWAYAFIEMAERP